MVNLSFCRLDAYRFDPFSFPIQYAFFLHFPSAGSSYIADFLWSTAFVLGLIFCMPNSFLLFSALNLSHEIYLLIKFCLLNSLLICYFPLLLLRFLSFKQFSLLYFFCNLNSMLLPSLVLISTNVRFYIFHYAVGCFLLEPKSFYLYIGITSLCL